MLKRYEAIYTDDGHLEWLGERPDVGRHRVIVTVLEQTAGTEEVEPPPTSEEIQRILDEMQRLRSRTKAPEEIQRILDETRGAWGTEKTRDEIDREIDAMRAEWDRPWDDLDRNPQP